MFFCPILIGYSLRPGIIGKKMCDNQFLRQRKLMPSGGAYQQKETSAQEMAVTQN
jgi:hypothetical protein